MEAKKSSPGIGAWMGCPCWVVKFLGRRDGKQKRDGSKWVARQVDAYNRFEIRELERTKDDQGEIRRKAKMLCANLDQSHRKVRCEEDRLRAEDSCRRWLSQLADLKLVLSSREESCIYRCMHQDALRRERIRVYLQEFERAMPQVDYAEGYRIGDPLYTGESTAWQIYRENIRQLQEDMDEKLLMLKGVK